MGDFNRPYGETTFWLNKFLLNDFVNFYYEGIKQILEKYKKSLQLC